MRLLTRLCLQRMDAVSRSSPKAYYALLWMLAMLGIFYLLLFPALIIYAISQLVSAMNQGFPGNWEPLDWLYAAGYIVLITLSAWVTVAVVKTRPDLPAGKPLDEKNFQVLVDQVKELCDAYDAPPVHHIKLTTDFGVELVRTPLSGYPIKFTNTLLIGLPVMICMSPLHLKLLMARQVGHLASTRKKPSRYLVYLRGIWNIYAHYYSQSWQPDTIPMRLFFCWYAPLFSMCSIAAVKLETLHKDQCLFDVTHAEQAAEMITVFAIKKSYLEEKFWPTLNNSAYKIPKPAYLPYQSMGTMLTKAYNPDMVRRYYEKEVSRKFEIGSAIPSLPERMTALAHEDFKTPPAKQESAAQHFLGEQLPTITKQLDNIWYLQNKTLWAQRFKQGITEKKRLRTLREQATQALLSNDEARDYLLLIEKYVAPDKSLPLYKEIYKTNLMDASVSYELGRVLLNANDPMGVDAMQVAMDLAQERTADCCQHIVDYMVRKGDVKEAQHYRRLIIEHQVEK